MFHLDIYRTLKQLHGSEETKQKSCESWRSSSRLTAIDQLPDYLQFRSNKQSDDEKSYQNNIKDRSSITSVFDKGNLIHSTPQKENSKNVQFNSFSNISYRFLSSETF